MAWQSYLSNYMRKQQEAERWRGFQNRFMELAREEQGRADVITNGRLLQSMDRVLRVSCNYHKHPEGWERGKPGQGLICLLDTPPHGVWNYTNDGISEIFFERARLCIAEAGRTLPEYPKGADPEDFWLHRLYLDLLKNNSDLLFCAHMEGGMILSVCVASATFCARLERQTLADAENGAKTGIIASLAEMENLDQFGAAERFHGQVKAAKLAVDLGDSTILDRLKTDENQVESSPAQNSENAMAVDIVRAIASWKRTHEIDGDTVPSGDRERAGHEIPRADVELIEQRVWVNFFQEARLPRPVELEWNSVLSSKKPPDEHVDLGLTLALTAEYAKAVARAVGLVADLFTTAAISRQLELTRRLREALWVDCLDFANGLARWDAFATWVDKVTRLPWEAPLRADGGVDENQLQAAMSRRRECFERKISMYGRDWLSAADGAINLRLTASVSKNSPTQNDGKATQNSGGEPPGSGALPSTWEELRNQGSISQTQAARFLRCDPRTVRRRVQDRELTRSPKGRIVCNELLRNQIRKVHGAHILR